MTTTVIIALAVLAALAAIAGMIIGEDRGRQSQQATIKNLREHNRRLTNQAAVDADERRRLEETCRGLDERCRALSAAHGEQAHRADRAGAHAAHANHALQVTRLDLAAAQGYAEGIARGAETTVRASAPPMVDVVPAEVLPASPAQVDAPPLMQGLREPDPWDTSQWRMPPIVPPEQPAPPAAAPDEPSAPEDWWKDTDMSRQYRRREEDQQPADMAA